jgi:ketosteroid isomerase-like protein
MPKSLSVTEARKEISALNKKFCEHANAKDPAGLVRDFYAPNARIMPPDKAANVRGTKAINKFWHAMIFKTGARNVTLRTQSVAASGDLAYEIGRYGYKAPKDPKGKEALKQYAGKYVVVYKRQTNGGLKAEVDMFAEH